MDKGLYTGVVYFDLKKAFDTVDHSILLSKLSKYGVNDIELKWFESDLSNRHQCCYLNRARSKMREIKVDVPQGSCLGPLLFLIYINDLPLVLKHATPSIFADDTQMATSSYKISKLQNQLAEDIENVIQWMADNKLSLNVLKTDFIIVGPRSQMRDLEETLCITIQNKSIYRAPFVKSLKFFIDENLDWGYHVSHVLKDVSSGLSILKLSKNYLPQGTLKILCNSLIETHFRYGNIIWGNCGETFLTRLQKLQNRAARIITGSDYDTPAEPLIGQLGWKTVREWIQNDTSVMMYKSMNNMAPTYLSDLFTCSSQFHSRDLRGSEVNLRPPLMATNTGQRSFYYRGAAVWNSLGKDLKAASSLQSFKDNIQHLWIVPWVVSPCATQQTTYYFLSVQIYLWRARFMNFFRLWSLEFTGSCVYIFNHWWLVL